MVITFDLRLPSITSLISKHWRAMCRDNPYLKEVFPKPPLVAYRRKQTTGSKLIRAKLPGNISRNSRILPGMYKCRKYGKECTICPWVKEGKIAISTNARYRKEITSHLSCQSRNILYIIECDKCRLQYIGETDRSLK